MNNEQIQKNENDAMESAWQALKPELDPSNWTTGESFTYRGFFCWGWEARRRYDSDQIDALKAEVARLKEFLKPFAAYAPHYPAQEDEPVAFLDKRVGEEQTKISVHVYTDGCKNLPEGVTTLYTRPQSDKLHEAAKEVVSAIIALDGTEIEYRLALNLATANKKLIAALKK